MSENRPVPKKFTKLRTPNVPNRRKPMNVRLESYIEGIMDDDGVTLENTAELLVYDVNKMFKPMLNLLIWNAYEAYSASLTGYLNSSEDTGQDRFKFHSQYTVGDMVMEVSTIYNETCHMDRIGRVLTIMDRSRGFVEIETLDGRSFTWDNANFIRIHGKVFREETK